MQKYLNSNETIKTEQILDDLDKGFNIKLDILSSGSQSNYASNQSNKKSQSHTISNKSKKQNIDNNTSDSDDTEEQKKETIKQKSEIENSQTEKKEQQQQQSEQQPPKESPELTQEQQQENAYQGIIQKIKNLRFPYCQAHLECLNSICLLPTCEKFYKVMCSVCREDHPDHSLSYVKNLKNFLILIAKQLIEKEKLEIKKDKKAIDLLFNNQDLKQEIEKEAEEFNNLSLKCEKIYENLLETCNDLMKYQDASKNQKEILSIDYPAMKLENFILIIKSYHSTQKDVTFEKMQEYLDSIKIQCLVQEEKLSQLANNNNNSQLTQEEVEKNKKNLKDYEQIFQKNKKMGTITEVNEEEKSENKESNQNQNNIQNKTQKQLELEYQQQVVLHTQLRHVKRNLEEANTHRLDNLFDISQPVVKQPEEKKTEQKINEEEQTITSQTTEIEASEDQTKQNLETTQNQNIENNENQQQNSEQQQQKDLISKNEESKQPLEIEIINLQPQIPNNVNPDSNNVLKNDTFPPSDPSKIQENENKDEQQKVNNDPEKNNSQHQNQQIISLQQEKTAAEEEEYKKNKVQFEGKHVIKYNDQMKKVYQDLSKLFDQMVEGSKTLIEKVQESNDYSLMFSTTLHSYKIKLKNKNKTATAEKNSSSDNKGMALVEKQINDESVQVCTLKIDSIVDWISVGICYKNQIINNKFKYDQKNIYMVCFNGDIWSHSKQTKSILDYKFQYEQDEIINIIYNPTEKIVTFQNLSEEDQIQLTVENPPNGDTVSFCIFLNNQGDQVSLL